MDARSGDARTGAAELGLGPGHPRSALGSRASAFSVLVVLGIGRFTAPCWGSTCRWCSHHPHYFGCTWARFRGHLLLFLGGGAATNGPSAGWGLAVFPVQLRKRQMEEEEQWWLQPQLLWAGMTPVGISARSAWSPGCAACLPARLPARPSLVKAVSRFLERGQKKQEKGIKMMNTVCLIAAPGFLSVIRE